MVDEQHDQVSTTDRISQIQLDLLKAFAVAAGGWPVKDKPAATAFKPTPDLHQQPVMAWRRSYWGVLALGIAFWVAVIVAVLVSVRLLH